MTPPGEGLGFGILPEKSISGQGCQVKNGPNFNYEIWSEVFHIDLIYYGVNSILLYKLWYYSIYK